MMLCIVFGCFNYLDIQRFMPLCKHKNKLIHYIGIVLLNICIISGFLITMLVLETLLSL